MRGILQTFNARRPFAMLLLGTIVALAGVSCHRGAELGTAAHPLKFYFMPLKGQAAFDQYAPVIKKSIAASSGLVVEPIAAPDFITIIKAFNAKTADVAFMNTLGYLMARDWTKATAHLRVLYGEGETTYRGAIVVRTGSVQSVKELHNKTLILSDPFSSSGYLYPLKLLSDEKVKPAKIDFAKGHLDALERVYRGEADAAATYYEKPNAAGDAKDARTELLATHPDALEKLSIIGLTDPIPNGPIVMRSNLPVGIQTALVGALLEMARTDEGRAALKNLYNVTGVALAKDADYDSVQNVLQKLGKGSEDLVEGGLSFYKNYIGVGLIN